MNTAIPITPAVTLEVPGDISSTSVAQLRPLFFERIAGLPAGKPGPTLELSLQRTRLIDSAGLDLVVSVLRALREKGGALRVTGVGENVYRIFVFTRLTQQMEIVRA